LFCRANSYLVIYVYDVSAVPGPPAALVIDHITSTSCTVNCDAPEVQENEPPVTGYLLEVRTLNGPWIKFNKMPITETEVRVTHLYSNISYDFRLRAINDNGFGECSPASGPVVPFTENRPSQPGRPVATVSRTSVNLEWSMLDGGSETKHLRYVIRYREANRERTIVYASTERKAGAALHHTLSNVMLKPDTDYEFAVAACNTAGLGPYSSYGYSKCVKTPSGWLLNLYNIYYTNFSIIITFHFTFTSYE